MKAVFVFESIRGVMGSKEGNDSPADQGDNSQ